MTSEVLGKSGVIHNVVNHSSSTLYSSFLTQMITACLLFIAVFLLPLFFLIFRHCFTSGKIKFEMLVIDECAEQFKRPQRDTWG